MATDLAKAFQDAANAGLAASRVDDDGTCNFDFVLIQGRRSPKLEAAATAAGFRATYHRATSRLYGGYWIRAQHGGQGNRNTRQCLAIATALRGHGLDAQIEYVTD